MSKGVSGIGRGILAARGLAGWLAWLDSAAGAGCRAQSGELTKYELPEPTSEIVTLFANIVQEVI